MASFNLDDYVRVNERLEKFRAEHPDWGLVSELVFRADDRFIVRAVVTDESGRQIAAGLAEEIRGTSMVNKTSPLENCETSAWGRALACLGYDVSRSIASREEMEKNAGSGAAATGTAAAAPPATPSDKPQPKWVEVLALVKQQKTTDEELAGFRAWLDKEKIPNDFAKQTDDQLNRVLAEVCPL